MVKSHQCVEGKQSQEGLVGLVGGAGQRSLRISPDVTDGDSFHSGTMSHFAGRGTQEALPCASSTRMWPSIIELLGLPGLHANMSQRLSPDIIPGSPTAP